MNKPALLIALLLTLAGCGKAPEAATAPPPPDSAVPAASHGPSAQAAPAAGTDTPAAQPADRETKPAPAAEPAQPEVKKRYRMNPKTYDIVPIDPESAKKVVLLTFDDGPKDKEMIESLIRTLDKHKAKAVFFVNGYRVRKHPELLKLIYDKGQIVGNHAWDHDDLKKAGTEQVDRQIGDVQAIVKELTGEAPRFFRPPFGSGSDYVREKAKREGLLYMTWSNGSKDWEMTVKKNSPDEVVQNVLDQLHPGSNILMHELPWTVEALDTLLLRLEEKGYGFVDPKTIETAAE